MANDPSNHPIIEQFGSLFTSFCCSRKPSKVNPVTKKEATNKEIKSSVSPTKGIQRSPTPGPEACSEARARPPEFVETKPSSSRMNEQRSFSDNQITREEITPERTQPESGPLSASEDTLPKFDIDDQPEPEEKEKPLHRNFHSDSTLSITDRPRIRPDGAGIRSGTVSRSLQNPFPEYDHSGSSQNSYYSCDLEGTFSLKELEEDELDIDDWGEGFDSDRTPRPASKLTMKSNTETIRKRGLFQNKKSQAIETPPSSDREDGENKRTSIFEQLDSQLE